MPKGQYHEAAFSFAAASFTAGFVVHALQKLPSGSKFPTLQGTHFKVAVKGIDL